MAAFTATDYDVIRDGIRSSAAALVPTLYEHFAPVTVIDVGCGEGWWAYEFERLGCDVLGVDGHDGSATTVPYDQVDLGQPGALALLPSFDMVVCLEVAEHLPPERAAGFVADLCALAPDGVIVFSAAVPGQGGQGHVNEQWPGYWAGLFNQHGRFVSGAFRWKIWDNALIEPWYRQNLLIACPTPDPEWLFARADSAPLAVVHPVTFTHIRALYDQRGRR